MDIPINLHHLKLFCHIVDLASYTLAAESLFMSQPSLSLQIKTLEKNLGATLFIRKGKKMELTEAGQIVYKYALSILNSEKKLKSSLKELNSGETGYFSICSNNPVGRYLLPNYIVRFMQINPKVEIDISYDNSDNVLRNVLEGRVDVGFVSWNSEKENSKVEKLKIYNDYWSLVCGTAQPGWQEKQYEIDEVIQQSSLISLFPQTEPGKMNEIMLTNLGNKYNNFNTLLRLADIESIKMAVISQLGIAFLPKVTIKRELVQGELKEIPLKNYHELTLDYYLITKKESSKTPALNNFIQFILNQTKPSFN